MLLLLAAATCVAGLPRSASAQPSCSDCEIQIGIGATYRFWDSTDGVVVPLTVAWDDNRYEAGIFRMATQQMLMKNGVSSESLAKPYWGVSASRRWALLERGPVRAYFGFGLAYRAETDALTATHLNFASQLGLHMRLPGDRSAVDLTLRHWSNAGIKLPNRGQDFATLTFQLHH